MNRELRRGGHGSHSRRGLWVAIGLALVAVSGSACTIPAFGGFKGATDQGHAAFHMWEWSLLVAMAVGVIVWILIFWSVIRYRKKSDELPKQIRYSTPVEILYTVVPILIVIGLFYFTVIVEDRIDAVSPTPAVTVRVTGYQWAWRFDYQGSGVSVVAEPNHLPQLVLPVGVTTRINLVSNDVVHGFYIPAFNFSRYAQPGVTNTFDFNPTESGTFVGRCAQYCGLYHSQMLFSVKTVSRGEFRTWLAGQSSGATA
ncbi:MAG TPA: cytochrome c oxidase subunit II [Acidimicrobiales bacterium]